MSLQKTTVPGQLRDLFHVHTFRCKHAENVPDEAYIQTAIDLHADSIWFTDHAPFPGNPFWLRMHYEQLEEYLNTLEQLKTKYHEHIAVHIGLETEYFPEYDRRGYYRTLADNERIELLLLGQHMAEDTSEPGSYTFLWEESRRQEKEHVLLAEAICTGMKTGYFAAVAHPDRIFRRCAAWTPKLDLLAAQIIETSAKTCIPLEINLASGHRPNNYRPEFWQLAGKKISTFVGLDAHSLKELSFASNYGSYPRTAV